ncbi:MAG: SRPBCC domain-containing protein [Candidatus Doudnabacteria bacterium]|nr:SRPBCC domain-containing protein [Candidatus Doudnabacteria bacterium]
MPENFIANAEKIINAPASKVWQALTDPAVVCQWLFGTEMTADWKVGGEIRYRGQWEGKAYEDKGTILELEPEQKIVSTYWSGFSGLPDIPENYQKVIYELIPEGDQTKLMITQEGNKTEDSAKHSETNWNMVLDSMKKLVEAN